MVHLRSIGLRDIEMLRACLGQFGYSQIENGVPADREFLEKGIGGYETIIVLGPGFNDLKYGVMFYFDKDGAFKHHSVIPRKSQ